MVAVTAETPGDRSTVGPSWIRVWAAGPRPGALVSQPGDLWGVSPKKPAVSSSLRLEESSCPAPSQACGEIIQADGPQDSWQRVRMSSTCKLLRQKSDASSPVVSSPCCKVSSVTSAATPGFIKLHPFFPIALVFPNVLFLFHSPSGTPECLHCALRSFLYMTQYQEHI